ncbi:TPA: type-F conjugative transfer system mating-pair stabilization protein TraN [Aeromonas veronii]
MNQCRLRLTLWLAAMSLATAALANEQYNQGSAFAKGIKSQEQAAINDFNPAGALPSYSSTPPESGYYGGETTLSVDLTSKGNATLNQSDVGKVITNSILNTPSDNKPSMDAPFISVGTEAQKKAETVTDGSFDGCVAQQVTKTEYTNHVCSRDTRVDQYCSRTAYITGDWNGGWTQKQVTIQPGQFSYYMKGSRVGFHFVAPESGQIMSATLFVGGENGFLKNSSTSFLNTYIDKMERNTTHTLNPLGMNIKKGDTVSGDLGYHQETAINKIILCAFVGHGCNGLQFFSSLTLNMIMNVEDRKFTPRLDWIENCPFNKSEGTLTSSQCTEPGGSRTIYVEGQPYTMNSDCWAYKDSYLTQSQSEGSCSQYIHNSACTVANRQCAYELDGFCLHENLTYSCEHKTTGSGVMCGGTFFCKDGSCAQSEAGKSNAFQKAVSELAAVAAAGKDVAKMNSSDVRAFTGKAMFCKKFAAGFNNCCKDSGWGQDIGLSKCSSDEKALGEARKRNLTVDVGEFCSKKVLKVCVEKKRSYCVFDSKLAQIVQQQGRQWQLGIGFGGASSPDCQGITTDQLQSIKFNNLDFSNFYADLKNGTSVPQDNALLQRVQQQIQQQMNNAGGKQ